MFDLYPRHGHRTPQQIAEDASGSFEPRRVNRSSDQTRSERELARDNSARHVEHDESDHPTCNGRHR